MVPERERFSEIVSHAVSLPIDNIDTDQIIPARFLRVTHKDGLAEALFADWRGDPAFVLNQPAAAGAHILVAGDNFGCGSSREHAAWALAAFGFRAVIATSFADIFRNNALKNGLLPVQIEPRALRRVRDYIAADAASAFGIELVQQQLVMPTGASVRFPIDPFSKKCLLEGIDELGYLLAHDAAISAHERAQDDKVRG